MSRQSLGNRETSSKARDAGLKPKQERPTRRVLNWNARVRIELYQLKRILSKHLDTFRNVSIQAPLMDYYVSDKNMQVLNVEKTKEGKFVYRLPKSSKIESFAHDIHAHLEKRKRKKTDPIEIKIDIMAWIRDALLRSGLCEHSNLEIDAMRFIKNYDDVILAPDTNILLNCVITSILLPKVEEKINEEIKGWPNWVLIAIPKLVMNEV